MLAARNVDLPAFGKPIKSEGEHEVVIKVHPQVEATLKVVVKENA